MRANSLSKLILAVIIALAIAFATDFFAAFVMMRAWGWFVVPITGFQPLSYWCAFGFMCFISFIRGCLTWRKNTAEEDKEVVEELAPFVARTVGRAIGAVACMGLSLCIMGLVSLGI